MTNVIKVSDRALHWLGQRNFLIFSFVCLLFSFLFTAIPYYLLVLIGINVDEDTSLLVKTSIEEGNLLLSFFSSCIGVPIIETFIFQSLPMFLIGRYISKKSCWKVIGSAILFGAAHYFNVSYMIIAFSMGLVFAYSIVLYEKHHNIVEATLVVMFVHGLRNGIALLANI